MTLRAYNNPQITGPVPSHTMTKLMAEHAKAAITRILQKRKIDTAMGLVTLSMGEGEGMRNRWKRHTVSHNTIANKLSTLPNETHDAVESSVASAFP